LLFTFPFPFPSPSPFLFPYSDSDSDVDVRDDEETKQLLSAGKSIGVSKLTLPVMRKYILQCDLYEACDVADRLKKVHIEVGVAFVCYNARFLSVITLAFVSSVPRLCYQTQHSRFSFVPFLTSPGGVRCNHLSIILTSLFVTACLCLCFQVACGRKVFRIHAAPVARGRVTWYVVRVIL
jgi:hypothetical protein